MKAIIAILLRYLLTTVGIIVILVVTNVTNVDSQHTNYVNVINAELLIVKNVVFDKEYLDSVIVYIYISTILFLKLFIEDFTEIRVNCSLALSIS